MRRCAKGPSGFRPASGILALGVTACLLLGIAPSPVLSQEAESAPPEHHFNGRYLGKAAADFGHIVLSPFRWTGKDMLLFGAAAGTTAVFFALDGGIQERVMDSPEIRSSPFSLFVTHFGEGPFLIGLSAALYAGGEAFRNDSLRKTGLLSLESFAVNGIIVGALKFILGRSRPSSGDGECTFNLFSWESGKRSFPSGHASSAFAVAAVVAGQAKDAVVGVFSYGLAGLVAVSRVVNNEHWASDVVAGSILGFCIGRAVLELNRPGSKDKPTLSLAPGPGGFSLSLRF